MQQEDILNWLIAHYGQERMRPGLSRMKEALGPLMPAFKNSRVITIAGTNGKGETTLYLSNLLKEKSHFVWMSPHIERITERFRSEKEEIHLEKLWELIEYCHGEVLKKNYELSFYEFLFFVFCTWAQENPPEYFLLEVGLGGRLDAVNVFDADVVLLPSLSRDHQEILGRRYEQILNEKLGTLRKGTTLISFLHLDYLREKSAGIVEMVGAHHIDLNEKVRVPEFQFSLRNYLLACAALCHIKNRNFDPSEWKLPSERPPFRGEILKGQNEWHLFGSHNVDGVRKLIQLLHSENYNFSRPPFDYIIVAFSNRNEKDLRVMLKMLKGAGLGRVMVTTFSHPKAAPGHVMEALSQEEGLDFVQNADSKVHGWTNYRVLVTGSYYFIGHFKSLACR